MQLARAWLANPRPWNAAQYTRQHTRQLTACSAAVSSSRTAMDSGIVEHDDGRQIAYDRYPPRCSTSTLPALLLCNGLLSDKTGRKAGEIRMLATRLGCEAVLFDYQAHGESPGNFQSLGPADWLRDAQLVLDKVITSNKVVIVGSSLGGWIAMLLARSRPSRTHGLVLIAPAVDISEYHWAGLSTTLKQTSLEAGLVPLHSPYVSTPSAQQPQATSLDSIAAVNTAADVTPAAGSPATLDTGTSATLDANPVVVSQSAGEVMLGVSFFTQGSRLLLLHDRSQFAGDCERWGAGRTFPGMAGECSGEGSAQVVNNVHAEFANVPVCVMHGEADDCVPLHVSVRVMHSLCYVPGSDSGEDHALMPMVGKALDGASAAAGAEHAWMVKDLTVTDGDGSSCNAVSLRPAAAAEGSGGVRRELLVVRAGDHRLSTPAELSLLVQCIEQMVQAS